MNEAADGPEHMEERFYVFTSYLPAVSWTKN
jgi:hypothetical protein